MRLIIITNVTTPLVIMTDVMAPTIITNIIIVTSHFANEFDNYYRNDKYEYSDSD